MTDKNQIERYALLRPILRPLTNGGEYSAVDTNLSNLNSSLMPELALTLSLSCDQWRVIENKSHSNECFSYLGHY